MLTGVQPAIIKSAAHNNTWVSMKPLMARLSVFTGVNMLKKCQSPPMIPLIYMYLEKSVFSKPTIMLQNSWQFIYNIIIL